MANPVSDLIIRLSVGINQRRLYFDDHPKVKQLGRDFTAKFNEMLARNDESGFFFGVLNGKFIKGGTYLVGPSIAGRNLIEFAGRLHCGGFLIRRELTPDEVTAFFRIGAETRDEVATLEDAQALLNSEGITNIQLTPYFRESGAGDSSQETDLTELDPGLIEFDFSADAEDAYAKSVALELAPLLPIFQSLYDTVVDTNIQVSRDEDLDLDPARTVTEELHSVTDEHTMDIMNLMRYPDYDSYTVGHSVRVSTLALTVGRQMGWPEHMLSELASAGLLHDIGKAKVPEEILYKPGKLTPEERKVAESHAAIGAHILLSQGDATPLVVAAAWGHHVRSDGGGYPKTAGWAVKSPVASLIQVCDVFEALTAARPYKNPLPPRRAFEIILKDRNAFNPLALTALIDSIGLYPPGSEVVLTDGSRGFVIDRGPDWEQPVVKMLRDAKGHHLEGDDRYIVHLHEEKDLEISDFLSVNIEQEGEGEDTSEAEIPSNEELVQGMEDLFQDTSK